MIDGLYAAASGMIGQQGRLDAISNDLANVSTPGYKTIRHHVSDLLYTKMGYRRAITDTSETGAGVRGFTLGRTTGQGAINRTDQPLDIALEGAGYLQVTGPDGQVALTRDGNLRIDNDRRITDSQGRPLAPNIRVPAQVNPQDISISADGQVRTPDQTLGQVRVVTVTAPDQLTEAGAGLFLPNENTGPVQAAGDRTRIIQGALESSNVDVSQSFSDMIEAQPANHIASRSIRTWDDLLSTANQIRR